MKQKKVAIVGAGVVGLTVASHLSGEYDITIVADRIGVESDSWKATAIWHVYLVPETYEVLGWAQQALEKFYKIYQDEKNTGVGVVKGVELFRKGTAVVPTWSHIPKVFKMLSQEEIDRFNLIPEDLLNEHETKMLRENPVLWGYEIEAPVADMFIYLDWLKNSVIKKGVQIKRQTIQNLNALFDDFDIVVNCSGFSARELAKDQNFKSYRGQYYVLKIDQASPTEYIGDDDHPGGMAYFIPRLGEIMIGGCAEEGVEEMDFTLDWNDTIKRAGLYAPWVRGCSKQDQAREPVVGIRPFRLGGIRLELDEQCKSGILIHNYGHGGSGFSLSWGCAARVKELIGEALSGGQ